MMQLMNLIQEIKVLLEEYEYYINTFNNEIIKKYSLLIPPLIASRQKKIPSKDYILVGGNEFNYNFHGNGCSLEVKKMIIDFDYQRIKIDFENYEWIYKSFDAYQLWRFIISNPNSNSLLHEKELYYNNINFLEKEGYIKRVITSHNTSFYYSKWIKNEEEI